MLRKADKAQLRDAVRNHAVASETAVLQTLPTTDHYVLDVGSLIHRLKWIEGNTYSSIADTYASFTHNLYGNVTVVFNGYTGNPSTKQYTIYITIYISVKRHTPQIKWTLQTQHNFLEKKIFSF